MKKIQELQAHTIHRFDNSYNKEGNYGKSISYL